jgi:hypothetical protein
MLLVCLLAIFTTCNAISLSETHRITNLPGIDLKLTNTSHFSGYLPIKSKFAATNTFYYYVQHSDQAPSKMPDLNLSTGVGPVPSTMEGYQQISSNTTPPPLLLSSTPLDTFVQ